MTAQDTLDRLQELAVLVPEDALTSSLAQQAYYLLRDRIVTLALLPGALVNERDLADELGIGRTPLRDAIRRLEDDGLVEVYPRRGVYVGALDAGSLGEVSEVRVELEALAGRLAARRHTAEDEAVLVDLRASLSDLPARPDQRTLIRLDQQIHGGIYRATHNVRLEATCDRYYMLALRLWFMALGRVQDLGHAVDEHHDLLGAILDRDEETASERSRAHVLDFEQQIRALL